MIVIDPHVTELTAGYEAIQAFLSGMRQEWLPGFERSYQRRTAEYRKALAKYDERGLLLRTLLGKPKQPGRMPDLYPAQVEQRLWQGWQAAIGRAAVSDDQALYRMSERLGEQYLALRGLRLNSQSGAVDIVLGPPGILLLNAGKEERAVFEAPVVGGEQVPVPVDAGSGEGWPAENTPPALTDRQVYAQAERLLARYQAQGERPTVSAVAAAEKLTAHEKERLLRLAATL